MTVVSAKTNNGAIVVALDTERLDASNAPLVKTKVLSAIQGTTSDRLIIDLKTVTFMDSTGLGALVSVRKNIPEHFGMELINTSDFVAKILKLTRMDRVFTF